MGVLDLLYIYDATIDFAENREDADYTIAHKGNLVQLVEKLRDLVAKGISFRRAVVTCHGQPGMIILHDDMISAWGLTKRCANQGLERLFPVEGARLSFNGCEVRAEPGGKEFVTTAAQIFLRSRGGTAFAMTSNGDPFPLPLIHSGHVVHFGGGIVSASVAAGGTVIPEPPLVWPDPPNGRDNVGNKI